MGIPIEKSFTVRAPADAVWAFLTNPHEVAGCLPGAAIAEQVDDATYSGTITVKVGPVTANYKGTLHFDRLDAEAREAELSASGQETKGKGGADMRMTSRVVERSPQETEVIISSDINVVGVLAQFGRGMIQDVSDQLFGRFTDCVHRKLEAPAAEAPAAGAEPTTAAPASAPAAEAPARAAVPEVAATAPSQAAEPALDVLELGRAAAGRAAIRTFRRPGFWIVVLLLALLVYWFFLR
jgi:carbon monoxide dehydrogenase subunit G